jgi:hypothetical protein
LFVLLFCLQAANAGWIKQKTNSFAWFRDVFFVNEARGWIVGTDGTLLSTSDGGATWEQTHKCTTDAFLQVHFTDENTGWILCERNIYSRGPNGSSYLRKTTDGRLETVIKDSRIRWADSLSFGPAGYLYIADSAISDVLLQSHAHIEGARPYHIFRFKPGVEGVPGQ